MPRFDLERVAQAAKEGAVCLEGRRAREHLLQYLPTWVQCLEFAAEVAQYLKSGDFNRTISLSEDTADEYGVSLPRELLERHGLDEGWRTWYVKLTLRESPDSGDTVVFISLHALERSMKGYDERTGSGRKSGPLEPSW